MKILFVLRSDAETKKGGDVNLLMNFKALLDDTFVCSFVNGVPKSVSDYDKVICANLDRPIEAVKTLELCLDSNVDFYLYTLHHPYSGIREYLRFGVTGFKKFISLISFRNPVVYEQFLWTIRFFYTLLFERKLIPYGSVKKAQKKLLAESTGVLMVSKEEEVEIIKDIGPISARVSYVPHLLDFECTSRRQPLINSVLCPGRIETRKNQQFILKLAKLRPNIQFTFVGPSVKSESQYFVDFKNAVDNLKNVEYLDALPAHDFYKRLSTHKVVLTASWFEVTSLIELFVLNSGSRLVSSKCSYNHSFFKHGFAYDSNDIDSCLRQIDLAISINEYGHIKGYPDAHEIRKLLYNSIGCFE
ncbi:glycosyltransferase family protein [Vibrio fortis]|uniref:hypothetical protein n=1 Tax=Vibrio fortis TaxID=212667 RepID=UPI0021C468B0|nr:hypothetical protein [Vibrio fortis]